MGARNFKELRAKMRPESRARSEAKTNLLLEEMAIDELRAARNLTQERLAKKLGVKQAAISRMERRADVYVSTLSEVIQAMGGRLEIRAVFPEASVRLANFSVPGKKDRTAAD